MSTNANANANQKTSPLAIKSNLKAGYNKHEQERAPAAAITQAHTKLTHFAHLIK